MSLYPPAYGFLMANEDSQRDYATVPDVGGFSISGINSHSWPAQYAAIAAIQQALRGPVIENFYLTEFWEPLQIGSIDDQDTANRVLDSSVNAGGGTTIRILQEAANACGASLTVDGALGVNTLTAVNGIAPAILLAAFRTARVRHYQAIVQANPSDEKYLAQWIARAQQ